MTNPSETLDIEEVIARWDEIMDRTEAGAVFVISVKGLPRARLEPYLPKDEAASATI